MFMKIFLYLVLKLVLTVGLVGASPQSASEALVSLEKAFQAYDDNQYELAAGLCDAALPALRASGDEENLGECLSLQGAAYHRLGIFDLALTAMEECYKLDVESGDPERISSSLNNLAGTYLVLGDFEMAEKMILDAIEEEKKRESPDALSVRYGMAADVFNKQGRYADAEKYASEAYRLDTEAGQTVKAAIRLSQLAEIYLDAGKLNDASRCLGQAAPVFESAREIHSLSICRQQQGILASKRGDTQAAIRYLQQAAGLARETGNRLVERNVLKDLAALQRSVDPEAAIASFERFIALNDSITKQETTQQLNEFRIKYELSGKEAELEAGRQRLHNQKRITALCLSLAVLFLMLSAAAWYLYRLRLRSEKIQRKADELKGRMIELGQTDNAMTLQERKEKLDDITREMADLSPDIHLTPREVQVAKLCADGLFSKEIGDRMGISQRTVETHKNNIFRKLGINTTIELVRLVATRPDLFQ